MKFKEGEILELSIKDPYVLSENERYMCMVIDPGGKNGTIVAELERKLNVDDAWHNTSSNLPWALIEDDWIIVSHGISESALAGWKINEACK